MSVDWMKPIQQRNGRAAIDTGKYDADGNRIVLFECFDKTWSARGLPVTGLFYFGEAKSGCDIINIPPTDVFFVSGEVNAPGSFPLKEGTSLQQALSLAQGATFKGSLKDGIIFREDPSTGKRDEIRADFAAIMGGKKDDIAIRANDVIIVPNSKFKSAMAPILNAFGYGASIAAGGRVIR